MWRYCEAARLSRGFAFLRCRAIAADPAAAYFSPSGQLQSPPTSPPTPPRPSSEDELSATPKSFPPKSDCGTPPPSRRTLPSPGWPSMRRFANASPPSIRAPTAAPVARRPRIAEPSPPPAGSAGAGVAVASDWVDAFDPLGRTPPAGAAPALRRVITAPTAGKQALRSGVITVSVAYSPTGVWVARG